MSTASTVAENIKANRVSLRISQSRLARLSGISRFKICTFELGDGVLTEEQQTKILNALQAEADRLRDLHLHLNLIPKPHERRALETTHSDAQLEREVE